MRELQNSVESRLKNDHGATMLESRPGVFLPMLYGMQKSCHSDLELSLNLNMMIQKLTPGTS